MKSKKDKLTINLYEMKDYKESITAFEIQLKIVKPSTPTNFSNLICKFLKEQLENGLELRKKTLSNQ